MEIVNAVHCKGVQEDVDLFTLQCKKIFTHSSGKEEETLYGEILEMHVQLFKERTSSNKTFHRTLEELFSQPGKSAELQRRTRVLSDRRRERQAQFFQKSINDLRVSVLGFVASTDYSPEAIAKSLEKEFGKEGRGEQALKKGKSGKKAKPRKRFSDQEKVEQSQMDQKEPAAAESPAVNKPVVQQPRTQWDEVHHRVSRWHDVMVPADMDGFIDADKYKYYTLEEKQEQIYQHRAGVVANLLHHADFENIFYFRLTGKKDDGKLRFGFFTQIQYPDGIKEMGMIYIAIGPPLKSKEETKPANPSIIFHAKFDPFKTDDSGRLISSTYSKMVEECLQKEEPLMEEGWQIQSQEAIFRGMTHTCPYDEKGLTKGFVDFRLGELRFRVFSICSDIS